MKDHKERHRGDAVQLNLTIPKLSDMMRAEEERAASVSSTSAPLVRVVLAEIDPLRQSPALLPLV